MTDSSSTEDNDRSTQGDASADVQSDSSADVQDNSSADVLAGSPESGTVDDDGEMQPPRYHPPVQEHFDWRGWLLVGVILVSFLFIPGAILYLPHAQEFIATIGVSWRQAYLALPMIPAILLGATAIWAAVSSRKASE